MPDWPIMAPLIGGQSNAEEIRRGQRIERPHHLSGGAHQNDCFTSNGHGNCRGTRFPGGCLLGRTSNNEVWWNHLGNPGSSRFTLTMPARALAKILPDTVSSDSSNHDLIRPIIPLQRSRGLGQPPLCPRMAARRRVTLPNWQ